MSSFSDLRKIGIIPTRMGTRLSAHNALRHLQDHPHAYGDKFGNYTAGLDKKGSSPRVWGQVIYNNYLRTPNRIIPTRMGTSCSTKGHSRVKWDHPHAYGDKYSGDSVFTMWERIIPTRMGTSIKKSLGVMTLKDHPHAYGDKYTRQEVDAGTKGSSPRVWGQVRFKASGAKTAGIIPTRMGTSSPQPQRSYFSRDHPHAYGDKRGICRIPQH